jgi:peptidylprolyl isomerase
MTKARTGDTVSIDYTLRVAGGDVLDSSAGRPSIRFVLGSGEVIPGLDQAVLGMELGESKTVVVPPALAHGLHRPERVLHFKRRALALMDARQPEPRRPALFTTFDSPDATVTEDYNHPLAGKDLAFEITLVSIEGEAH